MQILSQHDEFQFEKANIWQVQLNDDLTASAQLCESKDKCEGQKVNGYWNSFYDQAFKVELENGKRFLANWRYSLKEYVQAAPMKNGAKSISDVQIDDYDKFYSECDRSMIGFI